MSDCKLYREWLVDGHMGRLETNQAAELERHLNSCADCREAWAATGLVLDSITNLQDPEPSARVKADFRAILDDFKAKEKQPVLRGSVWSGLLQPRLRLAYGFLLVACMGAAYWLGRNHQQVPDPKQMLMLAMLDNPLASERIKAVNYTGEMKHADDRVIGALLSTLNNDPNDNVRLSTLEALAGLASDPKVRMGLIQSITKQESPVVQIAIAEVMLKLQEKRSVTSLKELLKQPDLNPEVKNTVQQTITKLI
ncbi:MAG: HEAT repeat domain-containing protein [Mucilaginibacter sp.]